MTWAPHVVQCAQGTVSSPTALSAARSLNDFTFTFDKVPELYCCTHIFVHECADSFLFQIMYHCRVGDTILLLTYHIIMMLKH